MYPRAHVDRLLRPRSIALVGASDRPGALGAGVLDNLVRLDVASDLYLVNPNRQSIQGRVCLASIADLPRDLDVAVLAIPQSGVLAALEQLGERQTACAIIFSAGFAEGGASGRREQDQIAEVAQRFGMLIVGPNCLGAVNFVDGIALTFVETAAKLLQQDEGIGLISQSGAMAAVLSVNLTSRRLGISYSISTGNEAVSGVEDYLAYLLDDPHTRVLGLIVEQFRQPQRFLELAHRAHALGKPLVLLHPGRSAPARQAAATHTGAMAGDHQVMQCLVRRAGVVLVDSLEALGDVLELALRHPHRPAQGTALITESGAFKALALDQCESLGLHLPGLDDASAPALRAALPDLVPVSNPLDLTAQVLVEPGIYAAVIRALDGDERFAALMLTLIQTDARTCDLKFPILLKALAERRGGKLCVLAGLDEGAAVPQPYLQALHALNISYFSSAERALRALRLWLADDLAGTGAPPPASLPQPLAWPQQDGSVAEYRGKELMSTLGVNVPQGTLVKDLAQARRAAEQLGYPLALKAQSAELTHKTDLGAVRLAIRDLNELQLAWSEVEAAVQQNAPNLTLDGMLLERMAAPGLEMILGARRDPDWGPVVLVGLGGVQAELWQDFCLLPPDMSPREIKRALAGLRSAPLLNGFRGSPAADLEALADCIGKMAGLMQADDRIVEIDINPLRVFPAGEGVMALDVLVRLERRSRTHGVMS